MEQGSVSGIRSARARPTLDRIHTAARIWDRMQTSFHRMPSAVLAINLYRIQRIRTIVQAINLRIRTTVLAINPRIRTTVRAIISRRTDTQLPAPTNQRISTELLRIRRKPSDTAGIPRTTDGTEASILGTRREGPARTDTGSSQRKSRLRRTSTTLTMWGTRTSPGQGRRTTGSPAPGL